MKLIAVTVLASFLLERAGRGEIPGGLKPQAFYFVICCSLILSCLYFKSPYLFYQTFSLSKINQ